MTTFSEATLPALVFTLPAGHPRGTAPALGRMAVTDAQGVDQAWLGWGLETDEDYAFTDSSGSGALYYEAESRTALGGAATAAGPSGASGGGNNVVRRTLTTTYAAMLSTQASGGGAHLTHVGEFRVYARVNHSTAAVSQPSVSVALQWGVGDLLRTTINDTSPQVAGYGGMVNVPTSAQWWLLDLGIVTIPKVLLGSQRWEGRILAKGAVGDVLDVDYVMLVPIRRASGIAKAVPQQPSIITFIARDEFDQVAGNLTGKAAPVGGNWVGAGDAAPDWVTGTGGLRVGDTAEATRTVVTGAVDAANTGRWCTLNINQAGVYLQAEMGITQTFFAGSASRYGLIVRYVDANNWLGFLFNVPDPNTGSAWLSLTKRVGGGAPVVIAGNAASLASMVFGSAMQVAVSVDSAGRAVGYFNGAIVKTAQDADLATGGALANGDVGVYSEVTAIPSGNVTHYADNLAAAAYTSDAAVYANRSLEVRHDGVIRLDSGGTFWQPVSSYEGDLLRIPPTGREGRQIRAIVKMCRNDPATGPDPAIDDLSATVTYVPRYGAVPTPV